MRPRVERWVRDNADTVGLLRRCWSGQHRPGDSEALSDWVTRTVMRGMPMFDQTGATKDAPTPADEKPYACPDDGCTCRFKTPAALGSHRRTHGVKGANTNNPGRRKAAGAPREASGPPEPVPSTSRTSPARGASSSAVVPAPHDTALPAGVVALLFTDVPLRGIAEMFGEDVAIDAVAGKGLAIIKPGEAA